MKIYINIYKHICLYTKCSYIFLSFVKLLFDTRKLIIIIRKQKIIKRIIFALFLLQKIRFEEIRENESHIIIYNYVSLSLYIIILFSLFF